MNTDGLSIVFPVMNRTEILCQSVPTWLDNDFVDEIIIVDWSSNIPIYNDERTSSIISNSKIRLIRVDKEKFFLTPSLSLNLGILRASNDNILKLDIDYKLINKKFFDNISKLKPTLKKNFFVMDSATCSDNPDNICLTGFVFFHRSYFLTVNGYNENLSGWGFEDLDLYDRMSPEAQKFIIKDIDKYIYHIPHSDKLRTINHIDYNLNHKDTERLNRGRAIAFPQKKMSEYITKHTVLENNKIKYEIVERIK